jgi:hypothetical protein
MWRWLVTTRLSFDIMYMLPGSNNYTNLATAEYVQLNKT